jgi:hypothetical protein
MGAYVNRSGQQLVSLLAYQQDLRKIVASLVPVVLQVETPEAAQAIREAVQA